MIADFQPNYPATIYVSLVDRGSPIVGATLTVSVTDPNGSVIVSGATPTDERNGTYSYTLASSQTGVIGTYQVTWKVTNPIILTQLASFLVDNQTVPSKTVREIRQSIARLIEGKEGFAIGSCGATSSSSLIIDPLRQEPDHQWKGGWFLTYGGTGASQQARVTDSLLATTSLAIAPNLTTPPDTTTLYEVHKLFNRDDYLDAIRLAIREVEHQALVPDIGPQITVVSNQMDYPIPSDFSHLYAIQIQMKTNEWRDIAPGCWRVNRANRQVSIWSKAIYNNVSFPMRMLGLRPPSDPLDDNSPIDVRANYVLHAAAAYLCTTRVRQDADGSWAKLVAFHEGIANQERLLIPRPPNNLRRVDN